MSTANYYLTNPRRRGILGHVSFGVRSYDVSKQFYDAVFKTLVVELVFNDPHRKVLGYGLDANQEAFTIFERQKDGRAPGAGTHLAFNAPNRACVNDFFKAAISNGGKSDGEPGLRENYGENYYAAFVFDPDGFRLEAVFQEPETTSE